MINDVFKSKSKNEIIASLLDTHESNVQCLSTLYRLIKVEVIQNQFNRDKAIKLTHKHLKEHKIPHIKSSKVTSVLNKIEGYYQCSTYGSATTTLSLICNWLIWIETGIRKYDSFIKCGEKKWL